MHIKTSCVGVQTAGFGLDIDAFVPYLLCRSMPEPPLVGCYILRHADLRMRDLQ